MTLVLSNQRTLSHSNNPIQLTIEHSLTDIILSFVLLLHCCQPDIAFFDAQSLGCSAHTPTPQHRDNAAQHLTW